MESVKKTIKEGEILARAKEKKGNNPHKGMLLVQLWIIQQEAEILFDETCSNEAKGNVIRNVNERGDMKIL
jgi:hypothetical protein